jgi:hypothetical protein
LRGDQRFLLGERNDLDCMRVRPIQGIGECARKNGGKQVDINMQLAMRVQAENI